MRDMIGQFYGMSQSLLSLYFNDSLIHPGLTALVKHLFGRFVSAMRFGILQTHRWENPWYVRIVV